MQLFSARPAAFAKNKKPHGTQRALYREVLPVIYLVHCRIKCKLMLLIANCDCDDGSQDFAK